MIMISSLIPWLRNFPVLALATTFVLAPAALRAADWGDQGDGTFKNPILPSDYSDPDPIRVGSDYYMVSSTFQYSGGVVVLHSKDLVNWETIGHAIDDVSTLDAGFNWDSMKKYKVGVYAPSIRYRPSNSTYYIYVNCFNGAGFYVCTATNPAGPWKVTQLRDKNNVAIRTSKWTDPCPMFDDDQGKAYLATANTGAPKGCYLFQLSQDGTQLLDCDVKAEGGSMGGTNFWPYNGTEGNKIYKWKGYYYLFNVDFQGFGPNGEGCYMKRSTNIYGDGGSPGKVGTYEVVYYGNKVPTQGGFVDRPDGTLYYIGQFNAGDYNGRRPQLLPVTWVNDFPWPGSPAGVMVEQAPKPVLGQPALTPQGSDGFNSGTLHPRWEWNHQPRAGFWSLTEQPGSMRLKAWPAVVPGNFSKVGNVLSQRVVGKQGGEVITRMALRGMADGQKAGLSAYWLLSSYSTFGVNQEAGKRTLSLNLNGTITDGPVITNATIWLRIIAEPAGKCNYSYSTDGKNYIPFGGTYTFGWSDYRGTRYGLFTYNDTATAGYVDFDFFSYRYPSALEASPLSPR